MGTLQHRGFAERKERESAEKAEAQTRRTAAYLAPPPTIETPFIMPSDSVNSRQSPFHIVMGPDSHLHTSQNINMDHKFAEAATLFPHASFDPDGTAQTLQEEVDLLLQMAEEHDLGLWEDEDEGIVDAIESELNQSHPSNGMSCISFHKIH
jgi:hypothetical protein